MTRLPLIRSDSPDGIQMAQSTILPDQAAMISKLVNSHLFHSYFTPDVYACDAMHIRLGVRDATIIDSSDERCVTSSEQALGLPAVIRPLVDIVFLNLIDAKCSSTL